VYAEAVHGETFTPNDTDVAFQKQLAYFNAAIHDESFERILFDKILTCVSVPEVDADGNFVYAVDAEGNVKRDGNGCPVLKMGMYRQVNDYYAALNNFLSQLNRLSFIDPKSVKLHALYAEDIISDILMSSPRSKLNSGEIAYMNSIYNMILILLQDARNGAKLNGLLTVRKESTQDVNLRSQNESAGKVF
jgi:hypothetical protein